MTALSADAPWPPGRTIVVHEVWNERVWAARPMRVVEDEGSSLALWFPRGTGWKAPTTPPARRREEDRGVRLATCLVLDDWVFRDVAWDADTLVLVREGERHAVWVSWLPNGEHWGWYVNLQAPYRRTRCGIETMDLVLDVIVDPDGSWRLKDEDELETFVEHGVFEPALADRIRADALAVVGRAERNEPPFDEPWPQWRPDPAWTLPELPPGWGSRCP